MANVMNYLQGEDAELDETEFVEKKSANLLLWIIGGFFLLFVVWASLTELDRTVRGMGRVVPSSKLQVVSNLEGGVVEEIFVKPGQTVKKGDILIRLSPTQSSSAYGSTTATVGALQTKIARLGAEVRGATPVYNGGPAGQVAVERSLHAARRAELQGLVAAGNARVVQAQKSVVEAESIVVARQSNLSAAQRELEMIRPLAEKEIVSRVDLIKAENAVQVAVSEVAAAQASVARSQSSIAEARASAAQARSDWMSRSGVELSQAQAELSAQTQSLPALSDRVDRTVIRAPMSGRVNRVLVTTVGGTVTAGMPIAEIVPSEESLYIEAMVKPQDIGSISIGQKATVEVTAFDSSIYGRMDGRVTSISPDAVLNEQTGESFYTVEVQTTSILKDKTGKKLQIGTGMLANVNLLGQKRSVMSYIFSPITKLGQNALRE